MTMTTIKVSTETRDRLKAQAQASNVTLGQHLTRLAEAADRSLRFEAMRQAIGNMSAENMAEYETEARSWTDADLA